MPHCVICGKEISKEHGAWFYIQNWEDYPEDFELELPICPKCMLTKMRGDKENAEG